MEMFMVWSKCRVLLLIKREKEKVKDMLIFSIGVDDQSKDHILANEEED